MKHLKTQRLGTTFYLWKDFSFEAAHQLTKVPVGHQCARIHGHSYRVRIHCEGKIDPQREWVVDYADIAKATRPLVEKLDHHFLNDILDLETTAENLAWWFGQNLVLSLPQLAAVEICETPTTSVTCRIR